MEIFSCPFSMTGGINYVAPDSPDFLTWAGLVERAERQDPVWISVAAEEGMKEKGCFPEFRSGKVYLGDRLCLLQKSVGNELLSRAICTNGRMVSVRDGRLVSRVMLRSCRRLKESVSDVPEIAQMRRGVEDCNWLALLVDEPVDPSGQRCLFVTDTDKKGGAELGWVLKNTTPFYADWNHGNIPKRLSEVITHLNEFAFCTTLPKNSEFIRQRKAAGIWRE